MEGTKKRQAQSQKTKSPKKAKKGSKKDGDVKIKRPLSAYLYFTQDFREERKAKGLDNSKVNEVAKLAGERWKSMDDEAKKPYTLKAEKDKERYQRETGKNVVKDSDKPKRPQTAYFIFLADFRKKMAGKKLPEGQKVPSLAGEKWRTMTDKEKEPYVKDEAKEKAKYEEAMKEYRKKIKDEPKVEKKAAKPKKKPEPVEEEEDEEDEEDEEEEEEEEEDDDDDEDDE